MLQAELGLVALLLEVEDDRRTPRVVLRVVRVSRTSILTLSTAMSLLVEDGEQASTSGKPASRVGHNAGERRESWSSPGARVRCLEAAHEAAGARVKPGRRARRQRASARWLHAMKIYTGNLLRLTGHKLYLGRQDRAELGGRAEAPTILRNGETSGCPPAYYS